MRINFNNKGFTLIELIMIIILLGILSATAVVLIGNVLEQQKFDETMKEMEELKKAIAGNPDLIESGVRSSFGYAGDMGPLPPTSGACTSTCGSCGLVELVNQCGRPSWTTDSQLPGTGYGWRGPYIDAKQDSSNRYLALLDGWGNYYSYNAATGQITSNGPDGASGGGDDIVLPGSSLAADGGVSSRVTDINSNPVINNNVTITHPNAASPGNSTTTARATNTSGFANFSAIPIGRHRIQTTVGTTYTKAVTVLPGQTVQIDFAQTSDPTTPSAVSSPAAQGVAPTQISLTWTAPTTNTDGSSLTDLAGYYIYRSTTAGFAPSQANLLANIGLSSSYVDSTISFGTIYYYHIRPVDKSGNVNTTSTQVSAQGINGTGSIVQITSATVVVGATTTVTQTIRNNSAGNITIRSTGVYWSGGNAAEYDQINFGGGGNEWAAGGIGSGGCAGNFSYTINAGTSTTLDIRFDDTVAGNTLIGTNNSIRINLYDATNCGGSEVAGNYTVQ